MAQQLFQYTGVTNMWFNNAWHVGSYCEYSYIYVHASHTLFEWGCNSTVYEWDYSGPTPLPPIRWSDEHRRNIMLIVRPD